MTEPESNPAASNPTASELETVSPAVPTPASAEPTATSEREAASSADRPGMLARILDWLRAGYPQGVPTSDYIALFAVLHRHLTDYEVVMVAEELVRDNPETEITREAIVNAIARLAMEEPDPVDVARVAEQLAEGGWPLEDRLADPAATEAAEPNQVGREG